MKRTLTLLAVLILLGHASINQAQPSLIFKKKLFGYEQNGPAGLSGCLTGTPYDMPPVFTKISGQDPANPGTILYGNCTANNSLAFPGADTSDFRMTFTQSIMTLYEEISNIKSKALFTGGMGYIEKKDSAGNYDTIMVVENFTVFMKLKCPGGLLPDFDGHVIGDIVPNKGNPAFLAEFTNNGKSNQLKARFLKFDPPSNPALLQNLVLPFECTLELMPMPGKGNAAYIAGATVPGKDSTMTFPGNTGTKMKLKDYTPFSNDSTVIPSVTVCHYPWKDTIPTAGADNVFANVFTDLFWLVGSNLTNVSGEMCFNYGKLEKKLKRKLKPSQLARLSGSWQDSSGSKFNKIKKLISMDTTAKEVCFEIDHFSNWTIALEKPAAARVVPVTDGATGTFVNQVDTVESAFELKFPGSGTTDTVKFERYDIDPGGEYDTLLVKGLSEMFWELNTGNNSEGSVGLSTDTLGGMTILYRPDAATAWSNPPVTRVRRGMKESMLIKPTNKKGQYIMAQSLSADPQLYTTNVDVTAVCEGQESTFAPATEGGIPPYTYKYNFGDSSPEVNDNTGTPQKHKYSASGSYSAVITVTDANLVDIVYDVTAEVNALPVPKITTTAIVFTLDNTGSADVAFSSAGSTDAVGWLWNFGDGTTSTEENPTHKYTDPTNNGGPRIVTLTVTSQNQCSKVSSNYMITLEPNSIEEVISSQFGLEIFPNPNYDAVFNVKFKITGSQDIAISVFDAVGKQVISDVRKDVSGIYSTKIDLSGYPKGMYLFKISDGKNMSIVRLFYQ
ncbi:MAG: hypothetical protein A3G23_02450 [Bacteroidetes bacterium RIFCSPLOWO2_12_FULL_37_12]|nr:MAG: hypothetical protein A3G23_02450 [Bacteroidetes bacterium RIFCSPLOWO2_12_FULL_37_12]